MSITAIISICTAIIIWCWGIFIKYFTNIDNKKIPIQSLAIGTLSFIISSISIKYGLLTDYTYYSAFTTCFGTVFGATAIYDILKDIIEAIWSIIKDTKLINYLRNILKK